MPDCCGECKYFRMRKESEYNIKTLPLAYWSDGECMNTKITKKDKDYDDMVCGLFVKRRSNEDI